MITVWGEGRGFRVAWLLEELGLSYRLRPVDMLAGVENDPEFLAINPAGFIPALQDGEVVMVESIAILEYLLARYGPSPLAPAPSDPAFPLYQQFLHLGEAGMAAFLFVFVATSILAPEGEKDNWSARASLDWFESRRGIVARQLARAPYMAGEDFTAADISITYALQLAERTKSAVLNDAERAYLARTTAREGYRRAMDACAATKAWVAALAAAE
ncbi:glutathione S-transferase family protein [Sphingomonas sp. HITSZ_GF]|uniref:glutathione S-transferase family protein n=1 Tax=Sphingomonas sp. HITSZ_GF TaxID=3037247 RepID=UPI00240DD7B1|nr:glutathione S-transferase family protein [Sphingomonas sp. HITSZ_GF]MDG2534751.1 glutathione S-transferase family protein [Sphingomonas sp. HITSZ_GF]